MAPLRRLGGDAVALSAAGIVIGTALAALRAPLLVALACAALPLATTMRFRAAGAACLCAAYCLAPWRGVGERMTVLDPFASARAGMLRPLVAAVPGDAGALAAGLTLGDASYFSQSFRAAMRESSTTHLVALSGFNVALMLGAARRALRGRVSTRGEAMAGMGLLVAFVVAAGAQPSLVRAALCGTAALVGALYGRRIAPARLLLITAALMLAVEPQLVTSLGFQLSFISSWALLATVGDVERMLIFGGYLRGRVARFAVPTLVAQLGVAPALLASVGSVMLVGLAVNPVLIPLTPALTAVAAGELVMAHVAPSLAALSGSIVAMAMLPVTAGIAFAARVPLELHVRVAPWLAAAFYAAWVGWGFARKKELW